METETKDIENKDIETKPEKSGIQNRENPKGDIDLKTKLKESAEGKCDAPNPDEKPKS